MPKRIQIYCSFFPRQPNKLNFTRKLSHCCHRVTLFSADHVSWICKYIFTSAGVLNKEKRKTVLIGLIFKVMPISLVLHGVCVCVRERSVSYISKILSTVDSLLSSRLIPRTFHRHRFFWAYIRWNKVTESMVTIRLPFCGYNLAQYVELIGEDLPCYSDKI